MVLVYFRIKKCKIVKLEHKFQSLKIRNIYKFEYENKKRYNHLVDSFVIKIKLKLIKKLRF